MHRFCYSIIVLFFCVGSSWAAPSDLEQKISKYIALPLGHRIDGREDLYPLAVNRIHLILRQKLIDDIVRTSAGLPSRNFEFHGSAKAERAHILLTSFTLRATPTKDRDDVSHQISPLVLSEIVAAILSPHDGTSRARGAILKSRNAQSGKAEERVVDGRKLSDKHLRALQTLDQITLDGSRFQLSEGQWEEVIKRWNPRWPQPELVKLLARATLKRSSVPQLSDELVDLLWTKLIKSLDTLSLKKSSDQILDILTQLTRLNILPTDEAEFSEVAISNLQFISRGTKLKRSQGLKLFFALKGEFVSSAYKRGMAMGEGPCAEITQEIAAEISFRAKRVRKVLSAIGHS